MRADLPQYYRVFFVNNFNNNVVADPGFPRGGCVNSQGGYTNLLFLKIFAKNCMKMKEFGLRGGRHP